MAWSDIATKVQLGALHRMLDHALLPMAQTADAAHWAEAAKKTRGEVSHELGRLRDLYCEHKLNKLTVFESEFWNGYENGAKIRQAYIDEGEQARAEIIAKAHRAYMKGAK